MTGSRPGFEMTVKDKDVLTGCLCSIGCAILYGMSYVFIKQASETASPFAILGWRYLLAFVTMSLLAGCEIIPVRLKGKNLRPLMIVALFCPVIYYVGETFGVSKTTASESGVIVACIPVATLIASTLILKKRPAKLQIAGILITLAGVLVTVFAAGASSSFSISGYLLLMVAVVSYALYSVFVEKAPGFTGLEITYFMLASGALIFVLFAVTEACVNHSLEHLLTLPFRNTGFLAAILYAGLGCSILAFFMSNLAILKIGVNRMSSFAGISTVVSILSGVVFLHEAFTLWQAVGAVVIIAGVYIANIRA